MAKVILETSKHIQYKLPGLQHIFFKHKLIGDLVFFLVVVALPSSFFALIPDTSFYDLRLLFFLVSSLYLIFYFKNLKKIYRLPGGIALVILNVYLCWQIGYSLFIKDIPLIEVITIFRANFFYPLAALGFLLYVIDINNDRIYRFMYWLLIVTFLQGILYIFTNISGVNIFAFGIYEYDFEGNTILQNMSAIPHYNSILFAFTFSAYLFYKSYKKHWFWIVPLAVTIISIVRSQMIVYFLTILLIFIFAKISKTNLTFSKFFKIILLSVFFVSILLFFFPSHVGGVINRFGFDKKEQLSKSKYLEEGTYYLRLELIRDSYYRTKKNNNLLTGHGYIRESEKGEPDFVVGGDTLIAPVLYTEGYIGITLRILPIFILLLYYFKLLFKKRSKYKVFAIVAIALILPEILNAVQTKHFTFYTREVFVLYVLAIVIYNFKKTRIKGEIYVT